MKIVFTGGGTAGHVMVNRILIPFLQQRDPHCRVVYIGSHTGMEKDLVKDIPDVRFYGNSTGKLRRYFSAENFKDIFRIAKGFLEAVKILRSEKPQLVYAGGGYVVVPVVWAARFLRIPVLLRETDYTIGLANRLCLRFAKEIFVTFPDTQKQVKHTLSAFPGMMIRPELYDTFTKKDLQLPTDRPVCLILGGSLGAMKINQAVWNGLEDLTDRYTVIHICGRNNKNPHIPESQRYHQIEFTSEIGQYLSVADVVVTRCGSNATAEGLSLGKHMVCIPITSRSSRGEQEQNAAFAVKNGNAVLLPEAELNTETILSKINAAIEKSVECPYRSTHDEMLERIKRHMANIYLMACEQLEKDMISHANGDMRLNVEELSEYEINMLSDAEENRGYF